MISLRRKDILHPPLKHRRYAKKAMTIALGILAQDGLVMAADTEISAGPEKLEEGKIAWIGRAKSGSSVTNLAVSGAGNLAYLRHLQLDVISSFQESKSVLSFPQIKNRLTRHIETFHKKHVMPFSAFKEEERPTVRLIVGAQKEFSSRLWYTEEAAVNPASFFAAVGCGQGYAERLLNQYATRTLDTLAAAVLAAFVLFQVKDFVSGCGKNTELQCYQAGKISQVPLKKTRQLDDLFREYTAGETDLFRLLLGEHVGRRPISRSILSRIVSLRRKIHKLNLLD